MSSSPPRALRRPFLTICALLGALASTACASQPKPPTIPVPDALRQACVGPAADGVQTVGDLAVFSVRQEAAIALCDARRASAVALIDQANGTSDERGWWPPW